MIKTTIELIYQTLFNFFVKRDGYNSLTHILASLLTLGVFFLITTNVLLVINVFSNDAISLPQNKGLVWLISLIVGGLNYFFLFSILRIEKEGSGENKVFNIDSKKSNGILRILTVVAICWCLSAAIEIIF